MFDELESQAEILCAFHDSSFITRKKDGLIQFGAYSPAVSEGVSLEVGFM